jgi:hypothetical protein
MIGVANGLDTPLEWEGVIFKNSSLPLCWEEGKRNCHSLKRERRQNRDRQKGEHRIFKKTSTRTVKGPETGTLGQKTAGRRGNLLFEIAHEGLF